MMFLAIITKMVFPIQSFFEKSYIFLQRVRNAYILNVKMHEHSFVCTSPATFEKLIELLLLANY